MTCSIIEDDDDLCVCRRYVSQVYTTRINMVTDDDATNTCLSVCLSVCLQSGWKSVG